MEKIMIELPTQVYDATEKERNEGLGIKTDYNDYKMIPTKMTVDIEDIVSFKPDNPEDYEQRGIVVDIAGRDIYADMFYDKFVALLRNKGVDIELQNRG